MLVGVGRRVFLENLEMLLASPVGVMVLVGQY